MSAHVDAVFFYGQLTWMVKPYAVMVFLDPGFNGATSFSSFLLWDAYHLVFAFVGDFTDGEGH